MASSNESIIMIEIALSSSLSSAQSAISAQENKLTGKNNYFITFSIICLTPWLLFVCLAINAVVASSNASFSALIAGIVYFP